MAKKKVKKVKLSDLLGQEGKANADLHKDDPGRRKHHVRHRTPRHRLITPRGSGYRPLAGDAKKDIQLNELAREWVSNGLNKTKAIAAVFGVSIASARTEKFMKIFDSSHFRAMVSEMLRGVDGEFVEPGKEYAIQRVMRILEMNILDYVDDDGRWLTVSELKRLPRELQVMLDEFTMTNTVHQVALKDIEGNVVHGADGEPRMVEHREQVVRLKLPDKTKNLELLGKFMEWIDKQGDLNIFAGDMMAKAEARVREREKDAKAIEGTAKRVTTD